MNALFSRGYVPPQMRRTGNAEKQPNIKLDPQQESVVFSEAQHVVVVAGAGSGKTRVLTERVKHLLEKGVEPQNIVAITFTNLAADEMRVRLSGTPGLGETFIGTIHSLANRIMKASGKSYKLLTDEVENSFMDYLISKYARYITIEKWLAYKDLKTKMEIGEVPESVVMSFLRPSESTEVGMFNRKRFDIPEGSEYPESIPTLCEDRGVITFDELLRMAVAYFKENNTRVEYVLVDEFQDVGALEYQFIMGLNAEHYFIIGDDWQSIYGFKGANVGIFMSLVNDEDFTTYYLSNNYRNCTQILRYAQHVIDQVPNRIPKDVTPLRTDEGNVTIAPKDALNDYLAHIMSEGNYKDWFILTRTNRELWDIAVKCKELGLPCVTFRREGMSLSDLDAAMRSNKVKLLTVHTSKGLEAENVILYGRFPLNVPSYMNVETEERRIMYVGITRAKDNLYILN